MQIFLVGGAVRDEMAGRAVRDRDYVVTGASEDEFLRRFPGARRVGRNQPVYIHAGGEYTLSESADIHKDLRRRDLTVNAMARDSNGVLIALPGALDDFTARRLRPVAPENFFRDPLRALRAARFAAQWPEYTVTPELENLMRSVARAGIIAQPAAERVGAEVRRACGAHRPERFLFFLERTGLLNPWLRELAAAAGIPAGPAPYHTESLLEHTADVALAMAGSDIGVWMGLCHDLGKTATDPRNWPHHYRHEELGAELAAAFGRRLRMPSFFIQAGVLAARWHMTAGEYDRLRVSTRVKMLVILERAGLRDEMFSLVRADKDRDFGPRARRDADRLKTVRLPLRHRNRGSLSGEILHQLRCRQLSAADTG